ncbi:hypothetical protein [Morganella sp. EGD-HP17]|uniref:hypothetical protein n=1 Tax=Morganella sp. EGD-HP17 TaxID=1435146 RepID=UPI0004214BFA|nr:hypothetical protein [Morganella sp. EGD-HP17]
MQTLTLSLSSVSYAGGYRLTVIAGAARYDKDGHSCGTVTPKEEADSVKRLKALQKGQALTGKGGISIIHYPQTPPLERRGRIKVIMKTNTKDPGGTQRG